MDLKEIRQLVKILSGTDVTELEIRQEGGQTLRISRSLCDRQEAPLPPQFVLQTTAAHPLPPPAPALPHAAPPPSLLAPPPVHAAVAHNEFPNATAITSPMVGTFFRASSPDAPPLINEGDMVKVGQTLCIIEAMKLMNGIEAEAAGRVVKVLKENASPVEYGDELFLIEPV